MYTCEKCGNPCAFGTECGCSDCPAVCKDSGVAWTVKDCYLHLKINGVKADPLPLCDILNEIWPEVEFSLVPNEGDGYIKLGFSWGRCGCRDDEELRLNVCDILSTASLSCLGDVCDIEPEDCAILMFNPGCTEEEKACLGECRGKWVPKVIPRTIVGPRGLILEPNEEGFYQVLALDDCGCIKEYQIKATDDVYQWYVRDAWPTDPDWPYTIGTYTEEIDLQLACHLPDYIYDNFDLEITVEYSVGCAHPSADNFGVNFRSLVQPYEETGALDPYAKSWVTQATSANFVGTQGPAPDSPWGTIENQVSRTFLRTKGKNVKLHHEMSLRTSTSYPGIWTPSGSGTHVSDQGPFPHFATRLHSLMITARPINRHYQGGPCQ